MKAEKTKPSFFARTKEFITKNWGLKLIALIIALVLYHSLKTNSGKLQDVHDQHLFQWR